MGKMKLLLLGMTLLFTAQTRAAIVWRVVYDPKTTAQVTANAASQKLIENQHNSRLDSIRVKQKRMEQYAATMATIKELYKYTLQNYQGLGLESKLYTGIFNSTVEIFKDIPVVFKALNKFPGKNHLLCLAEIEDVVSETGQCVQTFKDIVTNGKVKSPLASNSYVGEQTNGDGYNFLDRYDRYMLANRLYTRLKHIQYKLEAMAYMCKYCNNLSRLVYSLDSESWLSYMTSKNKVNTIINQWKGLGS